jgi:hypothetical protein
MNRSTRPLNGRAYRSAGADLITLMPTDDVQWQRAPALIDAPLATIAALDSRSGAQWREWGWRVIIDPFTARVLSVQAIRRAYEQFQASGSTGHQPRELFDIYRELPALAGLERVFNAVFPRYVQQRIRRTVRCVRDVSRRGTGKLIIGMETRDLQDAGVTQCVNERVGCVQEVVEFEKIRQNVRVNQQRRFDVGGRRVGEACQFHQQIAQQLILAISRADDETDQVLCKHRFCERTKIQTDHRVLEPGTSCCDDVVGRVVRHWWV